MRSTLWSAHCTSKQSLISSAFYENLSPREKILKLQSVGPFSFTDKANEIILLATSSGELTELRSLVRIGTITRSNFYSQGFHDVPWL